MQKRSHPGFALLVFCLITIGQSLFAQSNNANLTSLVVNTATLSPVFASGTTHYTATVNNNVSSVTITPTVADPTATVQVNGVAVSSGSQSGSIAITVGNNTITTIVTAQDGTTTQTYTINLTRALPLFPYSESFKNSTAGGLISGGTPGASLTAGGMDAEGLGYLRLTNNLTNQTGFARNTSVFPSANGLSISFEYYTFGGNGADGISFFLYDATANPFVIGAFGGSLGYTQTTNGGGLPGVSKGYIGIGIDEFGNFSNPTAGRQGGPGLKSSSVTLRGDGNGTGAGSPAGSNYEFLTNIQTNNAAVMSAAGAGSAFQIAGSVNGRTGISEARPQGGLTDTQNGYRKAKIELRPNGLGTGYIVNVWITEGNAGGGIVHHVVTDYLYISTSAIPANLSYGFASSTGSLNNYHEVRNLEILVPAGAALAPTVVNMTKTGTENVTVPFTALNFTSKFSSPTGNSLVKIKVLSLPAHGALKLNGADITMDQEINTEDLPGITFVPASDYTGTTSFQWNGSDGTLYSASNANVNISLFPFGTPPFNIDPIANASVNENTAYTGVVPSITGTPGGSLTYTLGGPDAFDFSINPATGMLSMIQRNFESPADANTDNVYELTITATDGDNISDTEDLTVTVLNVVETASFTINAIANATVNENIVYTGVTPAISGTPIGGTAPANFTFVPIPDTQFYTGQINGGSNSIFKTQTNWIVANKNALNINYMIHLGDCVQSGDNGGNPIEWMRVDTAISTIEDPLATQLPFGIPYGLNVGNHDQSPDGNASGTTNLYNQYFGEPRFAGRPYYGGHYGTNNDNNFQLFSASGIDFISVNLEYDPSANPDVLNWADNILKAYPARRAIVNSHYIINPDGSFGVQGLAIYNKLKVNPNLFLMLCGHQSPNGEARRTDTFNGNTVHTLLSDFQDRTNGGDGWMRYMEFMPSENKIHVSTYSPTLNRYERDANSQFILDYTMTSGANPGSLTYTLGGTDASDFTINSSTGVVSMVARNFESPADANSDNVYELTITATDTDGNSDTEDLTVTVTFTPSSNALLSELSLSAGVLSPVFAAGTYSYTVSVSNATSSLTITPIVADATATVKINGVTVNSGSPSSGIPLGVGSNTITTVVTAQDGSTMQTYTVTVTRAAPLFPYSESFRNSTAETVILGGSAVLTGGGVDANGAGYLRLTTAATNQSGFARSTANLPSANGLNISFEYYTYGGSGADGLSFFLFDATASGAFNAGAAGGSLGYAQSTVLPGVSKGYIGFGFDELGNFSNPTAGRQGGPGLKGSSLTIRGDGNGNAQIASNYEYLTNIQTSSAAAMAVAGGGAPFQIAGIVNGRTGGAGGLTPTNTGYRKARIELTPNGSGTGYIVNVWITEGSGGGGIVHHVVTNYSYISTGAIPANFNYGFAGSTGGMTNVHEVRNLDISIPAGAFLAPTVSNMTKSGSQNVIVPFTASNYTSKFSDPNGDPLIKIKVLSLPANGTLKLSGTDISVNQEIDLASLSGITFVPNSGFNGSTAFQWNGSDGSLYAESYALVNITISPSGTTAFPYRESFKNSTASGLVLGGAPSASLTGATTDAEGAGYLRLTNNAISQLGFARNSRAFPTGEGFSISFEYYTYGGSAADGISFFLYDATANASFNIGAPGGSLGYAQNSVLAGVSKGYLGIGLDEFGGFSTGTGGRMGGPGSKPSSVTIRGDGNGAGGGGTNYEYLTNIQTSNSLAMTAAGGGNIFQVAGGVNGRTGGEGGLTGINPGYRKAKIEMTPNATGNGYILNVWITEGNAAGPIVHHVVTDYNYISTNAVPANLSYGFAGSTGGYTNYHEIRNLEITIPGGVSIPEIMAVGNSLAGSRDFLTTWSPAPVDGGKKDAGNQGSPPVPLSQPAATNILSPNGDGKNDTWVIRNIHKYPGNTVTIVDRNGKVVYRKENYRNDWDGTFRGSVLAEDTYYYIVEFGKGISPLRGFISVVK